MRSVTVMIVWIAIAGTIQGLADENHQKLIRDAETIAAEYRSTQGDSDAKAKLKTQVKTLVQQSFDARQTAQHEQIREMREKLRRAEETLENREAIRDRIIDRKVEDLLSGQVADWQANTPSEDELFDVIGIGDTVAVYLPGVLPMGPAKGPPIPPNVTKMNSGRLVTGFPLAVGSDGAITMPMVDPIEVAGLTVRQAEEKIAQVYIGEDFLRPGKARPMLTLIPKEDASHDSRESLPLDPNNTAVVTAPAKVPSPPDVPSFEDTYGRISSAGESLSAIQAIENEIASSQDQLRLQRDNINLKHRIRSAEKRLAMEKLKLELERDYLGDVIEQLKTDLKAKLAIRSHAESELARSKALFASGTLTASALESIRVQFTERESDATKAKQVLDQYERILTRWKAIVGETLNADSKQRVDEGGGGGTGDEGQDDQQQ
ncbi:polysaccharide biosynthesis/export family protein [Stieleria mannarensis]|uniref:polysaccharide biosynthesis/export family protein n=1 Tax=Stieleria mannarensis TaxID=2755585 RepID=UPI001603310C|nr:polysaccharide biosynthesis/export family protein [Rhodopirellula sp. JC639]